MYHIEVSVFSANYLSLIYFLGIYDLSGLFKFLNPKNLTEFRYIWKAAERVSPVVWHHRKWMEKSLSLPEDVQFYFSHHQLTKEKKAEQSKPPQHTQQQPPPAQHQVPIIPGKQNMPLGFPNLLTVQTLRRKMTLSLCRKGEDISIMTWEPLRKCIINYTINGEPRPQKRWSQIKCLGNWTFMPPR